MTSRNQQLFEQSQKVIPGGVNSPVRALNPLAGILFFFNVEKAPMSGMLMENPILTMLVPGDR